MLKIKSIKKISLMTIVFMLLLSGCNIEEPRQNKGDILRVYASFYPIYFAAEKVGGERIELYSVIPNGSEPHDYEPSMREISNVENGDMFIYNGTGMEPWAEKLSNSLTEKGIKTINLSEYVDLIKIEEEDEHDEHNHDEHNHGLYDPHIWLDPANMDKMAHQIMIELIELDKANEDFYKKNYENFSERIKELDIAYDSQLKDRSKNTILVSHQAFGYLTKRYNLEQVSVTGITPHEEPSPRTLANLMDKIKKENFEYIFLESLASPKVVELLAKEGNLKVLELNPIAGLTKEQQDKNEDYFFLMEQNLENLKKALVR
ncbi:zinc ABC transporter substrate-binding protein [Proteiniborus sp. MB09-C3]|uniref:metal ABC transporter solute-binding protein, Zn/Mn family n=1 Tax=Proteiniborus sp. MB09-C3 TaxID=3050072 RepID=UPI002557973C|nr:zinc ABC transporter substrate-binding protein [Proteiniborus sp. MB09-C3]WIV11316.1 zinc ABC transporter substrate-binding protein [Proteiniborus sp. MB09-C3]